MAEWTVVSWVELSADYWVEHLVVRMEKKSVALMAAMLAAPKVGNLADLSAAKWAANLAENLAVLRAVHSVVQKAVKKDDCSAE